MTTGIWERDSHDAWDYSCFEEMEGWTVVAHKVGTAGSMDTYTLARESHNRETDEWSVTPIGDGVFTGVNAREEIYDFLGL